MGIELYWDYLFGNSQNQIIGEMTASQLPGRQNGGVADAYRHILLAAEFTRDYGVETAYEVLMDHVRDAASGADNGLDMWNNSIGIEIGKYLRATGGTWEDVVRISRSVIVSSFAEGNYDQIGNWAIQTADDGIRVSYNLYLENFSTSWNSLISQPLSFEAFATDFNRNYSFRSNSSVIVLEGGEIIVKSVAVTSPSNWILNPKVLVNGVWVELSVDESAFPDRNWFTGGQFIYEVGNSAPVLVFNGNQFLPVECFLSATPILLPDGSTAPIETLRPGDLVMSYDATGTLVPAKITRVTRNRVRHVLDVFGLMVTPGHVTLCGDGPFKGAHVPIIDILRSDGALVRADGSLVRATTGAALDSEADLMVWAVVGQQQPEGFMVADARELRRGTRILTEQGQDFSLAELITANGGTITAEGYVARIDGLGELAAFLWPFSPHLPQPEDYVLARSALTLSDIYRAAEWEDTRPRLPAPALGGITELGPEGPATPRLRANVRPNRPHALREEERTGIVGGRAFMGRVARTIQ